MSHPWEANVIGGVLPPRFVLCDSENHITNGEFEVNGDDWDGGGVSQYADPLTPFGDFVGRLDPTDTMYQTISPSLGALGGMSFALTLFARGSGVESFTISATSPAESHTVYLRDLDSSEYRPRAGVVTFSAGQTDTEFTVSCTATAALHVDRIRCHRVMRDITGLPLPSVDQYDFERQLQARTIRADLTITDYVLGWRFTAELKYDLLTAMQEIRRTQISEAGIIIFWPHTDANFVMSCLWDDTKYRRRYFHNRYLGHVGTIALIGADLLSAKPIEVIS